MFSKSSLAFLALATLSVDGALAAAGHRNHVQRHMHQKKALVYETTTTVTDTTWTTVYVGADGDAAAAPSAAGAVDVGSAAPAPTSASSSSSYSVASTSSTSVATPTPSTSSSVVVATSSYSSVAPTTLVTSTAVPATTPEPAPTTSDVVSEVTSAATSAAAAPTTATSSSSGNKRGAAYNDASLVSALTGTDSKIGWAYNWGVGSTGLPDGLEFVPMLWCSTGDFPTDWSTNAQSAIDAGSKYLLGYNEPDNPAQCNVAAASAATTHQTYMNPFSGKAKIGAPAVTNSNVAGQSLDWLSEWITACGGACAFDFCPVHWYNTMEAGAEDLFDFVTKAQATCGSDKTIWVTEFAPNVDNPTDAQVSSFLETVQDAFDNNATYSFVERYSYFYVADGLLVNGNTASSYGNTFAYA